MTDRLVWRNFWSKHWPIQDMRESCSAVHNTSNSGNPSEIVIQFCRIWELLQPLGWIPEIVQGVPSFPNLTILYNL
jgi:hypothetical protein